MSKPHRVLIARFSHESNRQNPETTDEQRFVVRRGLDVLRSPSGVLKGLVETLAAAGAKIEPVLSAHASPSGLVDHHFYLRVREELLDAIKRVAPDAIGLDLHGAMGTTKTPDAEGDLLHAIRLLVGPDVPIGVGLDLHAHVTCRMLDDTDICIAYKENPHSDTVECGQKVAELLIEQLEGRLKPVTVSAQIPMVLPGAQETASGPLAEIHAKAREYAALHPSIRDISIYNVYRFVDDDEIGQVVTILSDGPDAESPSLAMDLAARFWLERERFKDDLLTVDEVFRLIRNSPEKRPFAIGDMGDRVAAGAPGDSTLLLSVALDHHPGLHAAVPITDPAAAARAIEAGIGATVTLSVGAGFTPGFTPLLLTGQVEHVSDGDFIVEGPLGRGDRSAMGPTAVIRVDDRIDVMLTTNPANTIDPAAFTSQNIVLENLDFILVKSGYHFALNFGVRATPVLVNTPGVGYYRRGYFKYEKARFWPEHSFATPKITARQHSVGNPRKTVARTLA
ncbi:M81 family metallopeptidase [Mesorhizobium sp.]|uniref:M81 family metallopeptidase n=1 Tax=Mesorhizobium sp. TaxID=1871066 RepID=UPI000FE47714|nr:M81 family metallopeptidase [Mesorhizobium sp.]RWP30324.1 MAG: M81 family peptidase [Mesorhizobium sp.]